MQMINLTSKTKSNYILFRSCDIILDENLQRKQVEDGFSNLIKTFLI